MAIGIYPGSFDPPTVAHLAIAEAAVAQCGLTRVDLVMVREPLGKDPAVMVPVDDRLAVLEAVAASRPWMRAAISDERLIADLAAGYDVVVIGADKWDQVTDPTWYGGDPARRDDAVGRLPTIALAPRAGSARPGYELPGDAIVLDLDPSHLRVSASAARGGRSEWIAAEARRAGLWHDGRTGPSTARTSREHSQFTPATD